MHRFSGHAARRIANTIRCGQVFNLVAGFQQLLGETGFVEMETVTRRQAGRRILPAGRDSTTGRFSANARRAGIHEHVVFAVRPG